MSALDRIVREAVDHGCEVEWPEYPSGYTPAHVLTSQRRRVFEAIARHAYDAGVEAAARVIAKEEEKCRERRDIAAEDKQPKALFWAGAWAQARTDQRRIRELKEGVSDAGN